MAIEERLKRMAGASTGAPVTTPGQIFQELDSGGSQEARLVQPPTQTQPAKQQPPKTPPAIESQEDAEDAVAGGEPVEKTLEYLKENFQDAPTPETLAKWRQYFGDIFLIALSDSEVYIWRPLKRSEYKQLIATITEVAQKNSAINAEDWLEEKICEKCILWPALSPEWATFSKAGDVPTLANMIRESSNFVAPQVAVRLVRKL